VIRVDPASFVPIYEQIKKEVLRLVATGLLKARDPLPSIRDLAAELLVNPNTVARAYRELEQEGLISTQKGRGSFVAGRPQPDVGKDVEVYLGRILDEAIAEASEFGLGPDRILKLFEDRLRANPQGGKKGGRHE
jgi:GntR family transcriptional regulator